MQEATACHSTPPTPTSAIDHPPPEQALHLRLKTAGMRLQRVGSDSYTVVWLHQMVVSDLTLLQAAMFVHRALDRC